MFCSSDKECEGNSTWKRWSNEVPKSRNITQATKAKGSRTRRKRQANQNWWVMWTETWNCVVVSVRVREFWELQNLVKWDCVWKVRNAKKKKKKSVKVLFIVTAPPLYQWTKMTTTQEARQATKAMKTRIFMFSVCGGSVSLEAFDGQTSAFRFRKTKVCLHLLNCKLLLFWQEIWKQGVVKMWSSQDRNEKRKAKWNEPPFIKKRWVCKLRHLRWTNLMSKKIVLARFAHLHHVERCRSATFATSITSTCMGRMCRHRWRHLNNCTQTTTCINRS